MKLRSKLLLAAVSLLTVSVAATATSAYAWFAANRQVQATISNVDVRSTETGIKVELITDTYTDFSKVEGTLDGSSSGEGAYKLTTQKTVSDVSGKGDSTTSFHKPYIDATGTKAVGAYSTEDAFANVYAMELKFTADGEKSVDLFLSAIGSSLSATNTLVTESQIRLSACVVGASSSLDQKFIFLPAGSGNNTYLDANIPTNTNLSDAITKTYADSLVFRKGTADVVATPAAGDQNNHGYLATLDPLGNQKSVNVVFFMWVDGLQTSLPSDTGDNVTTKQTTIDSVISANMNFYVVDHTA
ncbi:MAG: hypothetical protein PUB23_00930 [Bacilli bacterium]|nr:hypothetical protein [Bacilli bacterium]